jgi:hypothetical protein
MLPGTNLRAEEEPTCIHETSVAVSAARDELAEFMLVLGSLSVMTCIFFNLHETIIMLFEWLNILKCY